MNYRHRVATLLCFFPPITSQSSTGLVRSRAWVWLWTEAKVWGTQHCCMQVDNIAVCLGVAGDTRDRKGAYKILTWLRHECSRAAEQIQKDLNWWLSINFQGLPLHCFTTSKETVKTHCKCVKAWWKLNRSHSSRAYWAHMDSAQSNPAPGLSLLPLFFHHFN